MAKKIITIGKKGVTEKIQGKGPVNSYSLENLQVNSPYTVGELPEDRFDTIQEAIDQWDADGQPNWPILVRPKKLTANYVFSSPPNSAGQYVENLVVPEQAALNPKGSFYNSDDVKCLTIIGLGAPYERRGDFEFEISNKAILAGNITLAGSTSNSTGSSIRLVNLAITLNNTNPCIQINEGIENSIIHKIAIENCYLFSLGDCISNVNNRVYVVSKNSYLATSGNLFSSRTEAAPNNLPNTTLKAHNCQINGLSMTGAECVPSVFLEHCKVVKPVLIEGDGNPIVSNFIFKDCIFDMNTSNTNRISDGESAIRISSTTGNIEITNAIMKLERVSGANCSVIDANTDVYLEAAISLNSLGTGDFAISSDGNAYTIYPDLNGMPPNLIPTTTVDGNVTISSPTTNLTP